MRWHGSPAGYRRDELRDTEAKKKTARCEAGGFVLNSGCDYSPRRDHQPARRGAAVSVGCSEGAGSFDATGVSAGAGSAFGDSPKKKLTFSRTVDRLRGAASALSAVAM